MVQDVRYELALEALTYYTKQGLVVYSPTVHYHHVYLSDTDGIKPDFEFFRKINFEMLGHADELYVLKLQGWLESKGVGAEIEEADRLGIRTTFVEPFAWRA